MHVFATLGAGVVLAWLSLPLLLRIARRDAEAEPASRHRTLIVVLVLSALLLGMPSLRATLETSRAGGPMRDAFISSGLGDAASAPTWTLSLPWLGTVVLACTAALWLLLVALRMAAILLRLHRVRGLLSRAVAPAAALQGALAREAQALGLATPALLVSEEVSVPFTARVLRPVIVVSRTHAETADPETIGLIFRHELSHVARHDVPVDIGVTLLLALFTAHPSARALAREIRFAREAAVDADVAPSAPRAYASLLVSMAERVHQAEQLEVGMDDTELCARVRRILDGPGVQRRAARMAPVALAFALLACSGAAVTAPESSAGSATTQGATAPEFSVRLVARDAPPNASTGGAMADLPLEELILSRRDVLAVQVVAANEQVPDAQRAIVIQLTPAGEQAMARGTAHNVGRRMAILVGDHVVAAPVIKTPLQGPKFQITTNDDADLQALANALGAH
jgi:beta-lactamase regulating signal transducer with metallopeptidase domain